MSSVEENDENRGVCPGGKHNSSSHDIFALDQPTGRPSILRQTENLPSKTVPKGTKVCFQTPRRDPLTKRIVSPSKSTQAKMSSMDECTTAMEYLHLDNTIDLPQGVPQHELTPELSSYPDDYMPIQSKGGYQLDFDNLDTINPFQSSNKMVLSPVKSADKIPETAQIVSQNAQPEDAAAKPEETEPALEETEPALEETLPFTSSVENSLMDASANVSSTNSSVVTLAPIPAMEEQESRAETPDVEQRAPTPVIPEQDKGSGSFVEGTPLLAKGSYSLDFDDLDAINPFQTGGSKIQNSPVLCRKLSESPPVEPQAKGSEPAPQPDTADVDEELQKLPVQPEAKSVATVMPISTSAAQSAATDSQPDAVPAKEGPVKLEFNFDDEGQAKTKRPPKKFGKRPPGAKPKEGSSAPEVKPPKEPAVKPGASDEPEIPAPKGSYSFDVNKFDDPNFNPFGTTAKMANSPKGSSNTSPVLMESAAPEPTVEPVEKEPASPPSPGPSVPAAPDHDLGTVQSQPEQTTESPMFDFSDGFVPGTTFMANDFDGQIDYLEQFGSSNFKESALRKQSLYLKFDPLLRESPKKCSAASAAQTQVPRPAALASRLELPQTTDTKTTNEAQACYFKLIDAAAPTPILECLVPPFPQPANPEEAIIEVLKYSQKDMDAAIAKVQAEEDEKRDELNAKNKNLHDAGQEMQKMIAELQLIIAKNMADQEKERELAQMKLNEALLEKEQAANDLNSMERSFSDLFKRLEKYKEVIEGYKKNQETLKACAQDHLARIKKEEQRYQTLKAHAEEKISRANAEITEVRSKYKAEVSALQAQLKREQLKAQSMEQSLHQKEKEAQDLTKLCDELISKVQCG